MNFAGKTAVVTGGSRGIGRAICEELARGGANVVLCYAGRAEAAQETVTACEDLGAKALAVQCNVADEAQVKALMDAAVKEFGRIDILVNNAGVTRDGLVMMMKEADFDAVIDTNLKGTFQRGGPPGQRRPGELRRQQGGCGRHDQVPGQGAGLPGRDGQRRGPRLH